MPARTYACTACGGQVDEQARRCRYCAAPVATVRCATCLHMNVPESGFCSGCGRGLGLEPVGEAGSLMCPLCKEPLVVYRDGAGLLFDCGACGGQFVDHALLREMVSRHAQVALADIATRLPGRLDPRTSYIGCPECHALMNRKNFGTTSGVVVDVCKKHGIWFDQGELPRVLAFVAAGGLTRSLQRQAEEAARLRHEAAAGLSTSGVSPLSGRGDDHDTSLADIFLHLLG